jgi:hypothetical protein
VGAHDVAAQHPSEDAATFLSHLECAPRGFGHPSALGFADQLRWRAQERVGQEPLVLFVLGEPLSGKSTFVSNLLNYLLNASGRSADLQVKLIRWGDAMRAQRHLGLLPADRVPGDLSALELANLSAFVGEQMQAASASMRGPGLVVAEVPGCTAVLTDGHIDGLDRGFSTCRAFVQNERAHYVALTAEPRLRATFITSRETTPERAANARQATPLAANRVREQTTSLMIRLHEEGRLTVAGRARGQLASDFDRDPAQRDHVLFECFLPHLLSREIEVPSDRAVIARNVLLPPALMAIAQADMAFVDQFDYIRERYNI